MAIEKMTFIDIKGSADVLDDVLVRCAGCGLFHPEYAARLSEYSIGDSALQQNPYSELLSGLDEMTQALGVKLEEAQPGGGSLLPPDPAYIEETAAYLDRLREEYPAYLERQAAINGKIVSYTAAMEMLTHVDLPDLDFDQLWSNRFLKIRFGRMPEGNVEKLAENPDTPYEFYRLDQSLGYAWCLYLTAGQYRDEVDAMFQDLGFERLRIPAYVHGTPDGAMAMLREGLVEQRERMQIAAGQQQAFWLGERDRLQEIYTRLRFLHGAYDMRRYAVVIRGQFHVIGFVQTRFRERFAQLFEGISTVLLTHEPAHSDLPIPVPVRLRGGWFTRPFQMFVEMYGSPSYNDIDPTPFVALTYTLLFGMMFGDLGHGFCLLLLGLFLGGVKKMDLGRIMCRAGGCAMVFGFLYGSVFGFEDLLDPFYTGVLGLPGKPIHIMDPATTNRILIVAIGIGAVLIFAVMLFNVCVGLRHRSADKIIFSNNGLAGIVFYGAVVYAGVSVALGRQGVVKLAHILGFIALPLLLIFFREPAARYRRYRSKERLIHTEAELEGASRFREGEVDIPALLCSPFIAFRFGRLPTDSYAKLHFYDDEPFLIYPLQTDRDYIWCLYGAAQGDKEEIDAIFHDLFFERIDIPKEEMETAEKAEAYIKGWMDGTGKRGAEGNDSETGAGGQGSVYKVLFPTGFGGFLSETFFELFEVVLSFVTNTMSFLRVGGFILVHAGMMEVVFQLSAMVGGGAAPVIIVVGNIFVMGMEGLIVGIQVLRLEFYEMFSRFYDGAGEPFVPYLPGAANRQT